MKHIMTIITLLLITSVGFTQEQEKRIKFNSGTLKICSNSHMTIKGYDGDEVIIKSLSNSNVSYFYDLAKNAQSKANKSDSTFAKAYTIISSRFNDDELEKGLKPLGNKSTNPKDNLYLDITEKPGELMIKDYNYDKSKNKADGYIFYAKDKKGEKKKTQTTTVNRILRPNSKYEILIPNSVKLSWNVEACEKKNSNTFFIRANSKPWTLSNFKGSVEISTSYKSISLENVTGPVIANTIGGNITVTFDEVSPSKLYSLVSNDGYIDVSLPNRADLNVDVKGERILSNIDFTVLSEDLNEGTKTMKLKLNSGKTKMKIDAGSGNVYLRKQE